MGICASSQYKIRDGDRSINLPPTTKIINLDGKLKELIKPEKAGHIISQNPECFLCSLESINIDKTAPHVPQNEELQLGQIYFLMPLSPYSKSPLSLQDMCALAIKASTALSQSSSTESCNFSFMSLPKSSYRNSSVGFDKVMRFVV